MFFDKTLHQIYLYTYFRRKKKRFCVLFSNGGPLTSQMCTLSEGPTVSNPCIFLAPGFYTMYTCIVGSTGSGLLVPSPPRTTYPTFSSTVHPTVTPRPSQRGVPALVCTGMVLFPCEWHFKSLLLSADGHSKNRDDDFHDYSP